MLSDCPHLRPEVDGDQALIEASRCADRACSWWDSKTGCACLGILPAGLPERAGCEFAPVKVPA